MDNLDPVNPDELPDGFSAADPNAAGGGPQKSSEAQQKEQQKQAILEQALTPDALARLRRIKVRSTTFLISIQSFGNHETEPIILFRSSLSKQTRHWQWKVLLYLWRCKGNYQDK